MFVLSLDLARKTGFCFGDIERSAKETVSGSITLGKRDEELDQIIINFGFWLKSKIEDHKPDLIIAEQWLAPQQHPSGAAVEMAVMLHGALVAAAGLALIPLTRVRVQTWRTAFCGRSTAVKSVRGKVRSAKEKAHDRMLTKTMTHQRAVLLGFLPKDAKFDPDISDSIGIWFWAQNQYSKNAARDFQMFDATP